MGIALLHPSYALRWGEDCVVKRGVHEKMKIIQHCIVAIFLVMLAACGQGRNEGLLDAASKGDLIKLKDAIEHGASIEATDISGQTAIFLAVAGGYEEIVKYLTEHGANLDRSSSNGITALQLAAELGNPQIVKILLEHGARTDVDNNTGWNALLYAIQNGNPEIVRELLAREKDVNALHGGVTPLYLAVLNKKLDVVQMLLAKGADPDVATRIGETPIALAVNNGDKQILDALRLNPNSRN